MRMSGSGSGGEPPIEKTDTLRGVRSAGGAGRRSLLMQCPGQADRYWHASARNRRATICVRLTFSFACQENACQV